MLKKISKIVCAVILLLGISTAVYASVLTIDETVLIPLSKTNWSKDALIPCFDEALGTLTSVDIDVYGKLQGTGMLKDEYAELADSSALVKAVFQLKWTDGTVLLTLDPNKTYDFTSVEPYEGVKDNTWDIVVEGNKSVRLDSSSYLDLFKQPQGLSLPVTARALATTACSGNASSAFTMNALANVKVTYTYAMAPEPSALFTLVAGVLGLGIRRIRRR